MMSLMVLPGGRKNHERGFTLIELLIVVIIIGILAAIALPIFLNQQKAANDARVQSDVRNTVDSIQTFLVANGGTAYASTSAYTGAGGAVTQTGADTIDVAVGAKGAYTVCGYTPRGASYTSNSSAYLYDSTTGQFGLSTAGCPGDAATNPTYAVGVSNNGTTFYSSMEANDPALTNGTWAYSPGTTTAQAHTGNYSMLRNAGSGYTDEDLNLPNSFNVDGSHTYTATAWIYYSSADTGVNGFITMADGISGTHDAVVVPLTVNTWTKVTVTGHMYVSGDPTKLSRQIDFGVRGQGSGVWYLDDVSVVQN